MKKETFILSSLTLLITACVVVFIVYWTNVRPAKIVQECQLHSVEVADADAMPRYELAQEMGAYGNELLRKPINEVTTPLEQIMEWVNKGTEPIEYFHDEELKMDTYYDCLREHGIHQ